MHKKMDTILYINGEVWITRGLKTRKYTPSIKIGQLLSDLAFYAGFRSCEKDNKRLMLSFTTLHKNCTCNSCIETWGKK